MSSRAADWQANTQQFGPVIYRRQDYVGFFRHLLIFAVDSCVILIVAVFVGMLVDLLGEFVGSNLLFITVVLVFSWYYLTVLKTSRFRTPGYWIADAKIVTIDGQRPSPLRMTLRLFWMMTWLFSWPVSFAFIDLIWATIDDERQMLRDLFMQTRLIRNSAKPIGPGKISSVLYTGAGLTLLYARVRVKPESG